MFAVNFRYPERIVKRRLHVELVSSGVKEPLGVIDGAHVYIGREPDEGGIPIPNQAVSRNHGVFVRLRNHWFYKDLGSTNGSWVNGVAAADGVWKLIRPGDLVQVADAALSISDDPENPPPLHNMSGFPALGGVSLVIFSKGEFLDEFPVPEYGRALVMGGSQGDLQIEGSLEELPSLIVERRGMNVVASSVSKTLAIKVSDEELTGPRTLIDRDEINIAHYFIIFNDPNPGLRVVDSQHAPSTQDPTEVQVSSSRVSIKDWEGGAGPDYGNSRVQEMVGKGATLQQGIFGKKSEERSIEETISIENEEPESRSPGYEMHPSMRYVMEDTSSGENMSSLDEKIIFIIGIVLLIGLVGLMIYWLFI